MSFIQSQLAPSETIKHMGHFHWLDKLAALLWCFVVIGIFMIIWMWTTEFAVTDRRVIVKRGWIMRKTEEISINRVEEVNLKQGILGRIFGYGTLQLRGSGGSAMKLPRMSRPLKFRNAIYAAKSH